MYSNTFSDNVKFELMWIHIYKKVFKYETNEWQNNEMKKENYDGKEKDKRMSVPPFSNWNHYFYCKDKEDRVASVLCRVNFRVKYRRPNFLTHF